MDIKDLKLETARMLLESDDRAAIEKAHEALSEQKQDFYGTFTEDQKLEIQFGIDQLDRGEKISWEDFKLRRQNR